MTWKIEVKVSDESGRIVWQGFTIAHRVSPEPTISVTIVGGFPTVTDSDGNTYHGAPRRRRRMLEEPS